MVNGEEDVPTGMNVFLQRVSFHSDFYHFDNVEGGSFYY